MTVLAAVALAGVAACGSSGSNSAGAAPKPGGVCNSPGTANLPAQINIDNIEDVTGTNSLSGDSANQGTDLAIQDVNSEHFLGRSRLVLTNNDTTTMTSLAVSEFNAAIVDKNYSVAFGPALSSEAVTMAPLAAKGQMPIIFTQAGSPGVVANAYTFRATAPSSTYLDKTASYLQSKNVKKLSLVYVTDNPTTSNLGTQWQKLAAQDGFTVSTTTIQSTTVDLSTPMDKALAAKPDAVALVLFTPQESPAVIALRSVGFTGPIVGYADGDGRLKAAGSSGAGVVWTTDFSPLSSNPGTRAFVRAFEAKYHGATPLDTAAEAYDRVWWLARAIKTCDSADRAGIQKGLVAVEKTGFNGAEGQISFDGNDFRVPGVLVQWNGTSTVLAPKS